MLVAIAALFVPLSFAAGYVIDYIIDRWRFANRPNLEDHYHDSLSSRRNRYILAIFNFVFCLCLSILFEVFYFESTINNIYVLVVFVVILSLAAFLSIVASLLCIISAFRCLVWVSGSGGGGAGRVVWGVWIPRRCSPPPCNCLTRGGCRAWSSVMRRTADGNCISRSGSRRVRGSPARNRGAARPRVRCMTRGSACGGI